MDHNLDLAQRYASQLSPEILLNIFRFTIPPDYCIDPIMKLGGRKNLWRNTIRTQKSVTLVCKSWNGPATEVLYEHIIFTRMGQIVAFARTLRSEDRNHAALVKSLVLDSCLVLDTCVNVVKEDLEFILLRCTQLRRFAFRDVLPHVDEPNSNALDNAVSPTWLFTSTGLRERTALHLRHLELSRTLSDDYLPVVHRLLSNAPQLISLKLVGINVLSTDRCAPLDTVTLPALQDLMMDAFRSASLYYVQTKWQLPALRSLTLLDIPTLPVALLRAHGRGITYLHLDRTSKPDFIIEDHADLGELCPALIHLALPGPLALPLKLSAPTLQHLDMWAPYLQDRSCDIRIPPDCNVRSVLGSVVDMHDLPRLFPPRSVAPGEWRVWAVAGRYYVIQTAWALLMENPSAMIEMRPVADVWTDPDVGITAWKRRRMRGCRCGESDWGSDEEDEQWSDDPDADYRDKAGGKDGARTAEDATSVVSDSDSSECEGDDASDDLLVDGEQVVNLSGGDDEQQLDRETILEMFLRSQDAWFEFEEDIYDKVLELELHPSMTMRTNPWRSVA